MKRAMHGKIASQDRREAPDQAACTSSGAVRRVLLLEDNMLIALDTQDTLADCGVSDVEIAAAVAPALEAIRREPPDFAVLDFNLGEETSEAVAVALKAAGVPYCFATGYGDALDRIDAVPPYGVLTKPYTKSDLADLLARVAADRATD